MSLRSPEIEDFESLKCKTHDFFEEKYFIQTTLVVSIKVSNTAIKKTSHKLVTNI